MLISVNMHKNIANKCERTLEAQGYFLVSTTDRGMTLTPSRDVSHMLLT